MKQKYSFFSISQTDIWDSGTADVLSIALYILSLFGPQSRVSLKSQFPLTTDLTLLTLTQTQTSKLQNFCSPKKSSFYLSPFQNLSILGPSLRWMVRLICKNCYALCHLFYIWGDKLACWTRMFILIYFSFYVAKAKHNDKDIKLVSSHSSFNKLKQNQTLWGSIISKSVMISSFLPDSVAHCSICTQCFEYNRLK